MQIHVCVYIYISICVFTHTHFLCFAYAGLVAGHLRKAALAGISSEAFDPYFRVIEWVVGEGADPAQQAPVSCTYGTDLWKNHDKKGP